MIEGAEPHSVGLGIEMNMKVTAIFGPPGTGKTYTLIELAKENALKNNKILYLSYTKAAALEASKRISSKKIEASTIHSMAYRALNIGKAQVVTRDKLESFSKMIGVPFKGAEQNSMEETQEGDDYLAVISYATARRMDMHEAYDQLGRPGTIKRFEVFESSYRDWKHEFGYVDFDDMLVRFVESDIELPSIPVVILDEAQDCSPLQWEVFEKIIKKAKLVYIAGDDDQAIYEWNGADPHGMIEFAEKHAGSVETLKDSRRVPIAVWEKIHNDILPKFERRVDKKFRPTTEIGLVQDYGSVHNFEFDSLIGRDAKILVRDRFAGMVVQRMLNASTIPYKVAGGWSPFDNRKANSIRAIIKANRGDIPTHQELEALRYAMKRELPTEELLSEVTGKDWRDIVPLSNNDRDFYESVDLDEPLTIELSTIHQAKGKEADVVILDLSVTAAVERNIEINRDAELRVWYVGCTRAKKELHICGENPIM